MSPAQSRMEEVPVLLSANASLEERVRHFQQWILAANQGLSPGQRKLNAYEDCPAHLVAAYLATCKGANADESAIARMCKCKKSKVKTGNGTYSGPFAFTLTKSDKDALTVGDMLVAVRKIVSQKSQPVVKYAWYYEDKGRDPNGEPIHPHIHGMYETATGGRIESKHFKRAWPIWDPSDPIGAGFRGGYHRPVKSEEKYADYIKKDGGMSESNGLN